MKRILALVLLGVVAFAILLVVMMPASVIVPHAQLPPGVSVKDAQGTLVSGSARATWQSPLGPIEIDRIEWKALPAEAMSGRLAYSLRAIAPQLEATGKIAHGPGGIEAFDLRVTGDASLAASMSPIVAAWRPSGPVTLTAQHLQWDDREIRGDALVEWRDAHASLPDPRALGSYRAEMHGTGGPARVTVTTIEGSYPVRAEGTVTPQVAEIRGTANGQDFALRLP